MQITWTNLAFSEYQSILDQLMENWPVTIVQRFVNDFNLTLNRIIDHPNLFKASSSHPYLRKAKINKHCSIIYQVDQQEIVLIRLLFNKSKTEY